MSNVKRLGEGVSRMADRNWFIESLTNLYEISPYFSAMHVLADAWIGKNPLLTAKVQFMAEMICSAILTAQISSHPSRVWASRNKKGAHSFGLQIPPHSEVNRSFFLVKRFYSLLSFFHWTENSSWKANERSGRLKTTMLT